MGRSLTGLRPTTAIKVGEMLRIAGSQGVAVLVYCTYRSPEEQAVEYAKGRTTPGPIVTNAKPGQSQHQFRLAVDAAPWGVGEQASKLDWSPFSVRDGEKRWRAALKGETLTQAQQRALLREVLDRHWYVLVTAGLDAGLAWAGMWPRFVEYVHFQDDEERS